MNAFLERLYDRPLLGDGAMGTLLYARGVTPGQCLEALVIEQPALIRTIHAEYARAGADVIATHTFGANRMRLAYAGLQDRVCDFNREAVHLARDVRAAMRRDLLIAGNVGPVGARVAWEDTQAHRRVTEAFREQIAVLVEAGVDLLLFETFSDVAELELAVQIAKAASQLPVVASMSYGADGLTLAGQSADVVTSRLLAAGVDVVGANCSIGPAQMVATLRLMQEAAPHAVFSGMPNAGLPIRGEDGQWHYPVSAQEFAGYVTSFLASGARLVGGCCGTTPEYIQAMRDALDRVR
jgi:homocysteine S-methyltransferase